ncbi:uncharacterized protein BX663DRAFT_437891, partial [Cokeromyces recurvatus]|uniref:uncharacterized protein n=1 Tax=Cokeromyces recurvatus TaxID=90255 RepID=UPI0022202AD0
ASSRSSFKVLLHLTKLFSMYKSFHIPHTQFLLCSLSLPENTLLSHISNNPLLNHNNTYFREYHYENSGNSKYVP